MSDDFSSPPDDSAGPADAVLDRYDEVFEIEIQGWCYGIEHYPGEVFPGLVYAILKELTPSFRDAIRHRVAFDLLQIAERLSRSAKRVTSRLEIAVNILVRLPAAEKLDEPGKRTLQRILAPVWKDLPDGTQADLAAYHARRARLRAARAAPDEREIPFAPRPRPQVFLSHASQDKPFARRLAGHLQAAGVRVWFDEHQLAPGSSVDLELQAAIRDSDYFLLVISQHSVASEWVRHEVRLAVERLGRKTDRPFVPLLLDDAQIPDWLGSVSYVDFRRPDEFETKAQRVLDALSAAPDGERTATFLQRMPRLESLLKPKVQPLRLAAGWQQWSADRVRDELERIEAGPLAYAAASPSAKMWWAALREENQGKPHLLLRLAAELAGRSANVEDFFRAYIYSNSGDIRASLHYLDFRRLIPPEPAARASGRAAHEAVTTDDV